MKISIDFNYFYGFFSYFGYQMNLWFFSERKLSIFVPHIKYFQTLKSKQDTFRTKSFKNNTHF